MEQTVQEQIERLRMQREIVLRLAALQDQVREALRVKMETKGLTPSDVSRKTKIDWSGVRDYLERGRVITHEARIKSLCRLVQLKDHDEEIVNCATRLGGYPGLLNASTHSPDVITLVFDLHESFVIDGQELSREIFSTLFTPHQDTVFGVLRWNRDAMQALAGKEVYTFLYERLISDALKNDLAQALDDEARERAERTQTLIELFESLVPHFESIEQLAKALKVHRTTLNQARNGNVSDETLTRLIRRANQLLGDITIQSSQFVGKKKKRSSRSMGDDVSEPTSDQAVSELSGDREPDPATAETEHTTPVLALSLASDLTFNASEASAVAAELRVDPAMPEMRGLPEMHLPEKPLNPRNFEPLAYRPRPEDLEFIRSHLETSRSLLNLCAQIQSDSIRAMVREMLSSDVEELMLAIRLFSAEFPNRLVHLFDAERETMQVLGFGKPELPLKGRK